MIEKLKLALKNKNIEVLRLKSILNDAEELINETRRNENTYQEALYYEMDKNHKLSENIVRLKSQIVSLQKENIQITKSCNNRISNIYKKL